MREHGLGSRGGDAPGDSRRCLSGSGALFALSCSGGGVGIDSESESVEGLSSVSVEVVGTEEDKGGSSVFPFSRDFVAILGGNGGTGGGFGEASLGGGGGGGAKGGNFNEIGTLRTCRKMAEAFAGQMAKN